VTGPIIDDNTGFTWEKKSDDGSIHHKDTSQLELGQGPRRSTSSD
jgi:hypothetical protein